MNALIDNDILMKGACYQILPALLGVLPGGGQGYGILGAARFVVPKLLERARLVSGDAKAQESLQAAITASEVLEPTSSEQELAAQLESGAQALALNLDAGESQLAAILASREIPLLVTGDKRAIRALEELVDAVPALEPIVGRVHCLEQCVQRLIEHEGDEVVCTAICAEPSVDKALTICCSCAGGVRSRETLRKCLAGYIDELRIAAPRVLATG